VEEISELKREGLSIQAISVALEPSHPIWFDEPTAVTSPIH
jgi:hypothetical protein